MSGRDGRRGARRRRAGRADPPDTRPGRPRARGRTAQAGAAGSSTSEPYCPLKSIVSTAPVAATSSTSAGAQLVSASSLKWTSGERSSRRRKGSIDGGLPRPSELTKRTGCGSSPSTSCSGRPAWRNARSSAADSNAQLRNRSATSHSGGSGHSGSVASCAQKLSSVHSPASGSAGCRSCSVVPSSLNTPTSSPSPSVSPPISRTWVVIRSKSYAIRARSGSYSQDSTTSGRSARRGHSDSPPIGGLPGFTSGSVAQGIPESSTRSGTVVVCPWTSGSN